MLKWNSIRITDLSPDHNGSDKNIFFIDIVCTQHSHNKAIKQIMHYTHNP